VVGEHDPPRGQPFQSAPSRGVRGRAYDNFLDAWHAEAFDPDELVRLFARAGARYLVPTSKHHDGIAL
jgi:alpha-L-fucosidase